MLTIKTVERKLTCDAHACPSVAIGDEAKLELAAVRLNRLLDDCGPYSGQEQLASFLFEAFCAGEGWREVSIANWRCPSCVELAKGARNGEVAR